MEALRIIKKVDSETLKELKKFIGQKVEIIILPIQENTTKQAKITKFKKIEGLPDGLEFQNNLRKEWKF